MITAIAIIALVLAAIAFGLALGNSSRQSSHERLHDTQQLIRSTIDRCTQSQLKHIQDWLEGTNKKINKQRGAE